jgi:hypothetical protein
MPGIEASLTPRERQVVGLITSPEIASQADVARTLSLSEATISEHLRKPKVERAIAARLEREWDKSQGEVARLRRINGRALDQLEKLVEVDLDPQTALLLVAKLGEATLNQLKIQELTPAPPARPETARDRERRRTQRCIRAGAWLQLGRSLLGWKVPITPPAGDNLANASGDAEAK